MDNMKKLFLAGCIVVVLAVIGMVVLVIVNGNKGTKELVCQSGNGNITLFYDGSTVVGYTANGYTYDLLSEKARAEEIGIKKYIDEFSNTYNINTFGTCTVQK